MADAPQTLNLISLAKAAEGQAEPIPGTALAVRVISEKEDRTLEHPLWLLLLEGELIIDLPFGDFRILKVGEALHLEAGLEISFEPLEPSTVLWQEQTAP